MFVNIPWQLLDKVIVTVSVQRYIDFIFALLFYILHRSGLVMFLITYGNFSGILLSAGCKGYA